MPFWNEVPLGRALRLAANRHCPAGQDVYCHSYTPVMTLDRERQLDIVGELASRPGHEKVRTLLYSLLVDGLGARSQDIFFEVPLNRGEIRGRADALLGRTVIELTSRSGKSQRATDTSASRPTERPS